MKLGTYMVISRQCKNLHESVRFFQSLGLTILEEKTVGDSAVLLTDGRMHLLLQQMPTNHTQFLYFTDDLRSVSDTLDEKKIPYEHVSGSSWEEKERSCLLLKDPNQFEILIQEIDQTHQHHAFTNHPRGDSTVEIGNFGEFAIPTEDYDQTKNFWLQLGFSPLVEEADPYPWGIFSDDLMVIGIHQAIDFNEPTLTYFKLGMHDVIAQLQSKGISFTNPENGITKSPDGQQIFFFEGDIK